MVVDKESLDGQLIIMIRVRLCADPTKGGKSKIPGTETGTLLVVWRGVLLDRGTSILHAAQLHPHPSKKREKMMLGRMIPYYS